MAELDLKAILRKRVDLEGLLVEDLISGFVKSALQKVVDDSKNPYDNMAMDALYPTLEKAAKEAATELVEKLLGPKPV
jgi:hypothetical protein